MIVNCVWHILALITGLYLFYTGFLRTRNEYHDISTTGSVKQANPSFRRVILLLVDALRYDFIAESLHETSSLKQKGEKSRISMPFLSKAFELSSRQKSPEWFLAHFQADAPTTTMQRIKALMTGTLPTFLDMQNNFAATVADSQGKTDGKQGENSFYQIKEDNLIQQWQIGGKRIVFVGDDTWSVLFPNNSFSFSKPMPSFNIRDLDTVDNAVKEVFSQYLNTSSSSVPQWEILIGHLLGIDHCGHTFGPQHSMLQHKLIELDTFIETIAGKLSSGDLMVVFGDHGMTSSGDHGGDSLHELDAAILMYAPQLGFPLLRKHKGCSWSSREDLPICSLRQIDLVPTLAALTHVPIPFSNLGRVFWYSLPTHNHAVNSVRENAYQILRYVKMYLGNSSISGGIQESHHLSQLLSQVDQHLINSSNDMEMIDNICNIIHEITQTFSRLWVSFHMLNILSGLSCLALIFVNDLSILFNENISSGTPLLHLIHIPLLMSSLVKIYIMGWDDGDPILTILLISNTIIISGRGLRLLFILLRRCLDRVAWEERDGVHSYDVLLCLVFISSCCGVFSNSFLVHEDVVTRYLISSLLFIKYFISLLTNESPSSQGSKKHISTKYPSFISWNSLCYFAQHFVLPLLAIRLSFPYRRCREEQLLFSTSSIATCNSSSLDPLEYQHDTSRCWYLSYHIILVIIVSSIHHYYLTHKHHLREERQFIIFTTFKVIHVILLISHCCIDVAQHNLTQSQMVIIIHLQAWIARLVFVAVLVLLTFLLWKPLLATEEWYLQKPVANQISREKSPPLIMNEFTSPKEVVPHLFHRLREQYNSKRASTLNDKASEEGPQDATIKVYGLVTSPFAWISTMTLSFMFLFLVVLGDAYVLPLVALLTVIYCCPNDNSNPVGWFEVIFVHLVSAYAFYVVGGHQPVISLLPWRAAFVGQVSIKSDTQPGFWISATLILFHLYAGSVMTLFAGAWLWMRKNCVLRDSDLQGSDTKEQIEKDAVSMESSWTMFCLRLWYLKLVQMSCSLVAVVIHRRHLMLWKIFAPRMMFAVVETLIYGAAILFTYLAVLRFSRTFHSCKLRFARLRELKFRD